MIEIFRNSEFEVRVSIKDGEPMFCLADVCRILGLSNPSQVRSRFTTGVALIPLTTNEGVSVNKLGNTTATFVSEANLYKCVFQSRKPQAEAFQDWVCGEVLPSIRKNGAYMSAEVISRALADPDFLIQLAGKLKAEQTARITAERENARLTQAVAAAAPKVVFADSVAGSNNSILVGELAKIIAQKGIAIGQNRMFEWLREKGYTMQRKGCRNFPTQRSIQQGLMEIVERTITSPDGGQKTTFTTKITGKGQVYFVDKFLSH